MGRKLRNRITELHDFKIPVRNGINLQSTTSDPKKASTDQESLYLSEEHLIASKASIRKTSSKERDKVCNDRESL